MTNEATTSWYHCTSCRQPCIRVPIAESLPVYDAKVTWVSKCCGAKVERRTALMSEALTPEARE